MGVLRRLLAVTALAVLAVPAVAGAQEAEGDLAVTDVDVSGFPEVTARVGVPAALGSEAVPPSAFTVTESGTTRPLEVTPLPAEELAVILVIDTSGSMAGPPLQAAKAAARTFLSEMPAPARIGVVGFGASPVVASPFTADREALALAVDALTARGETALYDALSMAIDQFPPDQAARRAIVVLSDGGDTASAASLDDAVARVTGAGVRLEVAELASPESDPDALARLAAAGNGRVASVGDAEGLATIYQGIASALANQYRVSFNSDSGGPTQLVFTVDHQGIAAERRLIVDLPFLPSSSPPPQPDRGLLSGGWGLLVGLGALALAMGVGGSVVLAPAQRVEAARLGPTHPGWAPSTSLGRLSGRTGGALESALQRRGRLLALTDALERAGLALGPGEFLVLWGSSVLVALLLGQQIFGLGAGLVLAALVVFAARVYLRRLTRRRQAAFADQLTDTLQLLSGSLRAGYALLQACEAVGKESPAPTSDEFRRLLLEVRLGREVLEALAGVARRVGSQDFDWVVGAIEIHREVGGDLAEVLDNVAGTIRDRDQLRRQIRTLTAEGRLSAYVLLALPIVMFMLLQLLNPGYASEFGHGTGRMLLVGAAGFMLVGAVWLKRLCRLVF